MLRRLKESTFSRFAEAKELPKYPSNHQPGMKVPKGGSMCANCKFLKDPQRRICGEPNFVAWNGSEVIPGKIYEYCSDWYQPKVASK